MNIVALTLLTGILSVVPLRSAVAFGQNKVQYRFFDWKYLTTKHFDIYFNQGGREIADFTAEVAEEAYSDIAKRFRYSGAGDKPIVMVTYQSHNDFEQTNVSGGAPEESVGGFTEFLKTRVVVPFEGDHERFRHVIHHELTHAMMLNLLYGQGFGAVISGVSQARVPLWFTEGLAEYFSRGGLDSETEMYLRDAVVNDLLPEIYQLNQMGYLGVYKCGQSVVYYIAYRYGDEKIGEILHQMKGLRDFNRALKVSIGIDEEELSNRWRRFIKERYWPQVANLDPPDRRAIQLTDHTREYCYINNSPSLSPNGEYLAFLSDRSDYFDVYLMRTIDGKILRRLVHGQKTGEFEELHWLRPGITWSPDGKYVALAAKAGGSDAIHVISVDDGKIFRSFQFESDALFSPSWSPDGKALAFILVQDGDSDLATVSMENGKLTLLTQDLWDDADPSWSLDSKRILFTSNRKNHIDPKEIGSYGTLHGHTIASFDVFEFDVESNSIRRITEVNGLIRTPQWMNDGQNILFVSDQSGIFNLYKYSVTDGEATPITNVTTGYYQPTIARAGKSAAFTSYFNHGYDIFLVNDIASMAPIEQLIVQPGAEVIPAGDPVRGDYGTTSADYSDFVFDRIVGGKKREEPSSVEADSLDLAIRQRAEEGKYLAHDYKVSLEPDYVTVSASYSPYFRMQGSGMILFSDVLGNHDLYVSADFNRSTENSNLYLQYNYLARRPELGFGVYHFAYPFYSNHGIRRDRNFGIFLQSNYPFNRYNRLEYGIDYGVVQRSDLIADPGFESPTYESSTLIPRVGYVHDTSIWRRSTAPANGERWRIDGAWSPNLNFDENSLSFTTLNVDWRKYFSYRKQYSFAIRFSGGASYGSDPQKFFLGGVQNWFNPRYDNSTGEVQVDDLNDIYYSSFVGPLRGVGYYNQTGERYALMNAEFRFPFIRDLIFGWPLPLYIHDLQGALFTDWGAAWYPRNRLNDSLFPEKPSLGFGFGLRLDLGFFPIEWDVAWSPDPRSNLVPQYYFSINTGF